MKKINIVFLAAILVISSLGTAGLYAQEKDKKEKNRFSFSIGYKQHYSYWDPV